MAWLADPDFSLVPEEEGEKQALWEILQGHGSYQGHPDLTYTDRD